MKNKFSAEGSLESRQILRCVGIDPYTARENLVWAPNWSHTIKYAEDVLAALKKVKGNKTKIVELLTTIARAFIRGDWSHGKDTDKVENNDD